MDKWKYQNKPCYLENRVVREPCAQKTACNFLGRTIQSSINMYIYTQKVEKDTLKSCSEILFFYYCPELPKRLKEKDSCSKMWLIDQLYIKLGSGMEAYVSCTYLISMVMSYCLNLNFWCLLGNSYQTLFISILNNLNLTGYLKFIGSASN